MFGIQHLVVDADLVVVGEPGLGVDGRQERLVEPAGATAGTRASGPGRRPRRRRACGRRCTSSPPAGARGTDVGHEVAPLLDGHAASGRSAGSMMWESTSATAYALAEGHAGPPVRVIVHYPSGSGHTRR